MEILLIIAGLGVVTGFLSGLLGIGGGIVMAPLLLYVLKLFGLEALDMRTVAGLTIVQGFAACVFGAITHHRFKCVSGPLVRSMGTNIFVAAAFGGAAASFVSNQLLLSFLGSLAAIAETSSLFPCGMTMNDLTFRSWDSIASGPSAALPESARWADWWVRVAPSFSSG